MFIRFYSDVMPYILSAADSNMSHKPNKKGEEEDGTGQDENSSIGDQNLDNTNSDN